jgi:hypothetical protein
VQLQQILTHGSFGSCAAGRVPATRPSRNQFSKFPRTIVITTRHDNRFSGRVALPAMDFPGFRVEAQAEEPPMKARYKHDFPQVRDFCEYARKDVPRALCDTSRR